MATIEEVSAATVALEQAAGARIQDLEAQLAAANTPDPNVQAAADAIAAANDALQAIVSPPAPAEPAPTGDVTNADGSVTHADGSVTNADGSVTAAPAV